MRKNEVTELSMCVRVTMASRILADGRKLTGAMGGSEGMTKKVSLQACNSSLSCHDGSYD